MTDWCTGPCTAAHPAPENGDCQICADAVSLYETDSGKIFDPNGPALTTCDACGELIQYYDSHEPVCDGRGTVWDASLKMWRPKREA